jgi:hypothetical protein
MQSKATTVEQYLKELPEDRRAALSAIRKMILQNLDKDFEEGIQYGMIGYYVPHRFFPDGYHCDPKQSLPFVSVASQKNHMAIYLMCIYMGRTEDQFRSAWLRTGKKLDMGKSCIRFKKLEDVALDVIAGVIRNVTAKDFVARYQEELLKNAANKPAKISAGVPAKKAAKKAVKKSAKSAKAAPKKATKK